MPKKTHIRQSKQIRWIIDHGKKWVTPYFIGFYLSPDEKVKQSQQAIITSKKLGNAVHRNRIRRRIREAYRKNQNLILNPLQFIFIGRKKAKNGSWSELESRMKYFFTEIQKEA